MSGKMYSSHSVWLAKRERGRDHGESILNTYLKFNENFLHRYSIIPVYKWKKLRLKGSELAKLTLLVSAPTPW